MRLEDFDYELPPELVAQHPGEGRDDRARDGARLLAHDVAADVTEHLRVRDLERRLRPGDLLVVNDTRVLPARLEGRRRTGGRVELLLLAPEPGAPACWSALLKPGRRLRVGERIELEAGASAELLERPSEERADKVWRLRLHLPGDEGPGVLERVHAFLERVGDVPLPPYIRRVDGPDPEDREAYQTVYARHPGAVAAPTAGLHFTSELLERLAARGIERAALTLHVGHGTFLPIETEDVRAHRMHAERYTLPAETADRVNATRRAGGRVVAVGTTSVRVLESCVGEDGEVHAGRGETRLFLHPGRPLRVVDALVTNFHLPRSSLLLLVSAFAGRERVLRLYREAVERRYRFYSYGDAMLLEHPVRG